MPQLEDFPDKVTAVPAQKRKWTKMRTNWIAKKAGGVVKLRNHRKKRVVNNTSQGIKLKGPGHTFYETAAYEKKFGCLKANEATPYKCKDHEGRLLKGYIVRKGEVGVHELETYADTSINLEQTLLDHDEELGEDHADDVAMAAASAEDNWTNDKPQITLK